MAIAMCDLQCLVYNLIVCDVSFCGYSQFSIFHMYSFQLVKSLDFPTTFGSKKNYSVLLLYKVTQFNDSFNTMHV